MVDSEAIDLAIATLVKNKAVWQQTKLETRLEYLQSCLDRTLEIADRWTETAGTYKGIDPQSQLYGEEHIIGPISLVRYLRLLKNSLAADGQPPLPEVRTKPNGQRAVRILPANLFDRLLWLGYDGEVWLEPTAEPQYIDVSKPSQLALVLGAGNVSAIAPLDTCHQLFVNNRVVILKLNPVNDYLLPYLSHALAPLIDRGFLSIVCGGAKVGAYLCQHPAIETIHLTGSTAAYDAIVWGDTKAEREQRKAINQPRLSKEITAELGCVTPIILVPGNWSRSSLEFQARQVAATIAHNASFNCAAGQVLVLPQHWQQKAVFIDCLRQELARTPPRHPYYPGAEVRYQTFLDRYPQAEVYGTGSLPWTLIPHVKPERGEYALSVEAFCGILAIVELPAATAAEFLPPAVDFVNDCLWGTLSCTLLIDRATQQRDRAIFERAIADLRYGAIGINVWSGMLFYLGSATWGAYPGNPAIDIASGCGIAHNTYLLDRSQKTVVIAPFRPLALPAWFATHPNLRNLAQALIKFESNPHWLTLIPTIRAALMIRG